MSSKLDEGADVSTFTALDLSEDEPLGWADDALDAPAMDDDCGPDADEVVDADRPAADDAWLGLEDDLDPAEAVSISDHTLGLPDAHAFDSEPPGLRDVASDGSSDDAPDAVLLEDAELLEALLKTGDDAVTLRER